MNTLLALSAVKTLPPPDTMYRALLARDTSYDGAFFAAIRTTGIFCRPGCGAKKPQRENVEFFATAADAERRGYRACLRCRAARARSSSTRADASQVDAGPPRDHSARRRTAIAGSARPSIAHRFRRVRHGSGRRERLRVRERLPRRVRALFGAPPTRAAAAGADVLRVRWIATPLGPMLAAATDDGVCLLEFADRRAIRRRRSRRCGGTSRARSCRGRTRHLDHLAEELEEYLGGRAPTFTSTILAPGTPFQSAVWDVPPDDPAGRDALLRRRRARDRTSRGRARRRARERRQSPRDPDPLPSRHRIGRLDDGIRRQGLAQGVAARARARSEDDSLSMRRLAPARSR